MFSSSWQRAALIGAALCISAVCATDLFAQAKIETKSKKSETSKDIIEKAYNLSLQKDRSQAISILVGAAKQEGTRNGNTQDLLKALQQVSYLFYSDRAQQNFELALSLRRTDLPQAQQKIAEALRVEPDNLSVFNEMLRMLLIKGDCSGALDGVAKQRLENPFDENLFLIQAEAQACLGKWDAYAKTRDAFDAKKSSAGKAWAELEVEYQLFSKNLSKAKESVSQLQKMDSKYPELFYWQWRVFSGSERAAAAEKYLKECKNMTANLYRQYMTNVNLCRKVVEVETASKNTNEVLE
jgi:tetratricopeptide (TPR) repeat protein